MRFAIVASVTRGVLRDLAKADPTTGILLTRRTAQGVETYCPRCDEQAAPGAPHICPPRPEDAAS